MAHAHVLRESWKKFEITKVWNNCLACHQGCARWEHSCVTKMEHDQTIWFCRDDFLWPCYFEKTWLLCLYAWSIIIFMSILNFFLESFGSEHSCNNKENYIEIMLGSIPHQKFCFYHLPTRGRAGIKLGDTWYVSNISIIFDCSMLLYYLFWMFYMH